MLLVGGIAAVIWGIGGMLGAPKSGRWFMLGILYLTVLTIQFALPDGHALRLATGESPDIWLILGGFALFVAAYRWVLGSLRNRVLAREETAAATAPPGQTFSPVELDRYARHIMLREVGGPGQKRLKNAKVLVVGAGGLGSPALLYLAAAGVGTIGVIDDDTVSLSNLQRQIAHTDDRTGTPKVFSAEIAMKAVNPHVMVKPYNRRLTAEIAPELFAEYDLILDGSDLYSTREMVNAAAIKAGVPLVSGAIAQWEGQLTIYDSKAGTPCFYCIFPSEPAAGLAPSCAEAGVIGALPGVIGSMMALEAIKVLTGAGTPLRGAMLLYDGLYGETRQIALKRRLDCACCAHV